MANIYQKIAKVMSQVKKVPKNGYNAFHKYHYATETDLLEAIRDILTDAGLAFYSSVEEQQREGEFTKVKMKFAIVDTETGEKLESTYWGEGQDKGDKGLYKAYTGATKYFLMKTFLIPTGDDPEADVTTDERNHGKQVKHQTITDGQIKKLHVQRNQLGMSEDDFKASISKKLGRKITSLKDLTKDEASMLIEQITKRLNERKGE